MSLDKMNKQTEQNLRAELAEAIYRCQQARRGYTQQIAYRKLILAASYPPVVAVTDAYLNQRRN